MIRSSRTRRWELDRAGPGHLLRKHGLLPGPACGGAFMVRCCVAACACSVCPYAVIAVRRKQNVALLLCVWHACVYLVPICTVHHACIPTNEHSMHTHLAFMI
jgi:hypothetical protein